MIPHLDTWCIELGTQLSNNPPVSLDFLIQADIAWYETWRKYKLPPFEGCGPMGSPGVAVYGNTGSVDMGGWGSGGETARVSHGLSRLAAVGFGTASGSAKNTPHTWDKTPAKPMRKRAFE